MLTLPTNVKLFMATQPVDFRKSFDGLASVVEHHLGHVPHSGHVFVFLNKRANQVRLLFWDDDGFCLVCKRLEMGTFRRRESCRADSPGVEINTAELVLLLEGIDVSSMRRRKRYVGGKKFLKNSRKDTEKSAT